jgi:long-chain acyl-CoA synthetase
VNLSQLLMDSARRCPGHPAIRFQGQTITYEMMNRRVDSLAHGLKRMGLKPGQVCVLMMPSSLNWALTYYALAKLGAVVVPVNPLFKRGELEHIFHDSRAQAFIGHGDYLEQPRVTMAGMRSLPLRIVDSDHPPAGFTRLSDCLIAGEAFPAFDTGDDDPFAVIYTSGTTGLPKGAVLTHQNLMADARLVGNLRHTEPGDVVLSVLPLFHIYGQTHSLNISILYGLTIRMWERFEAEEVMAAVEEEESSILYAVPTMVNRLVELGSVTPPKRSSLRFVISGGASLPVEVLHKFEDIFETTIYESYGLTECAPTCVENPFGRPTKPGSIGLPVPGFEARIVDVDDHDLPPGEVGELLISGPAVMKGYLNQPGATAEALRGGWLHTGDLARFDEEGYIYIVDRRKELIIRGGYNVYPREIEEILYTHPGVVEAAVVGVPHKDLGEEVAAVLVMRPGAETTEEDIRRYVKDRVAPYKYPRLIKFIDELPKTATGKIFKRSIEFDEL